MNFTGEVNKSETDLETLLSPWAMRNSISRGRKHSEPDHPYRSKFQRDRERILHCSAFRRLEYKTQVFVYHEGDYYRTRLTHSLEVSQIARSIARALRLNEDLAEAIAIAHDLGHPPFGHSGEKILDKLMKKHGGFEHNCQSLRIVEHIENRYPDFRGLNLTYEVREGMAKHQTDYDHPEKSEFGKENQPTLEAQVVDFSDSIAYNSHDLDDGITSGMLDIDSLNDIRIWNIINKELPEKERKLSKTLKKNQIIKALINKQVSDLLETTVKNLSKNRIKSVEEVRNCHEKIAAFSSEMTTLDKELKIFLRKNMYKHQRVVRMEEKAALVIRDLFSAFIRNPKLLPPNVYDKLEEIEKERLVCDYIAGMTDRFALLEHKKLFNPYERV